MSKVGMLLKATVEGKAITDEKVIMKLIIDNGRDTKIKARGHNVYNTNIAILFIIQNDQ